MPVTQAGDRGVGLAPASKSGQKQKVVERSWAPFVAAWMRQSRRGRYVCDVDHDGRSSLSLFLPVDCRRMGLGGIPMGATIEAVGLRQDPETATQSGVVCIFCGLPTPVRASSEGTFATHLRRPSTRVSLVRCE